MLRQSTNRTILASQLPECLAPYIDMFSEINAKKLAPNRDIDLAIELQPGKKPLYRPIYFLLSCELAALQSFLKENLAKRFIRESKSLARAPILFASKRTVA